MSEKKKSRWWSRKTGKGDSEEEDKELRLTISDGKSKYKFNNGVVEAKVVLLGDSGVGKTSISTKYSDGYFPNDPSVTLGGSYCK